MRSVKIAVQGAECRRSDATRAGAWIYRTFSVLILLLLIGCTTTSVQPGLLRQPAAAYRVIVVGQVSAADEDAGHTATVLARRGLVAELIKSQQFAEVLDTAPIPPQPGSLLVSGKITEIDKGSTALRFIIGFGAGRSRMAGEFKLADASGATLAQFSVSKEYSGGAGIGGADFVDMDTLATQLGEAAAGAIVNWARKGAVQ
jgi:Domain of unknown function (DUF4410)